MFSVRGTFTIVRSRILRLTISCPPKTLCLKYCIQNNNVASCSVWVCLVSRGYGRTQTKNENMAEQYDGLSAHNINESVSRPTLSSAPTAFALLRSFAASDRLTTIWHLA